MIHNLKPHSLIINKLKDLMHIQSVLLSYATEQLTIHYEESKRVENTSCTTCSKKTVGNQVLDGVYVCLTCLEYKCREYLENLDGFSGRGTEIANWLYASKERREPFLRFMPIYGDDFIQEKQMRLEWVEQMQVQINALLNNEKHIIMHKLYDKENKVNWQDAGALFLIQFYDSLHSKTSFPASFFSDAKAFGRQDFLRAFLEKNHSLYICAICDEVGYYTVARGSIRTDIEHYFPKSIYPHLAIHPYNLIPICGRCNSIHGDKDPFDEIKSTNRLLGDVFLSYRGIHLSKTTYMDFTLKEDSITEDGEKLKFTFAQVEGLKLRPQYAENKDLQVLITLLKEMYDIPGRWQSQTDWTNKVGETLFRRLRQYLRDARNMPSDHYMLPVALQTLDHLLYSLYEEDMRKDPNAFAMTWLLTKLLNEYVEPFKDQAGQPLSGFLQEIDRWFKKNDETNNEHTAVAEELKAFTKGKLRERNPSN